MTSHLGEAALLVDECQDVERFAGQHVERALVVVVVDVRPDHALASVLLLLQLEHVPHKELLQLLIGKVDAQLLKATTCRHTPHKDGQRHTKTPQTDKSQNKCGKQYSYSTAGLLLLLLLLTNLFFTKFSKPKMSSRPMHWWTSSLSSGSGLNTAELILSTTQMNSRP